MKKLFIYLLLFNASIAFGVVPATRKKFTDRAQCIKPCTTCNPCPASIPVTEGFIFVPAAIVNGQEVPAANIFARQQGTYVAGQPTIIFLHCLETNHRDFLCQQQAFSALGYNTLAIDLRGRGDSSKTDPLTFAYTNQAMANDLHSLLISLGIQGPLILVASVSGGYTALKYFQLFSVPTSGLYDPLRTVSHLALLNSGPGLTTVPDCAGLPGCIQDGSTCCIAAGVCPFPCGGPNCCVCWDFSSVTCAGYNFFFLPTFSNPIGYLASSVNFAQSVFGESCTAQVALAKQAFSQAFMKTPAQVQLNLYINALAEDLRPMLVDINIPLLSAYGTLSPTNAGSSLYIAANVPNSPQAIVAEFQGIAEQPQITSVNRVNQLLKDFIQGAALANDITYPFNGCDVCPLYVPQAQI